MKREVEGGQFRCIECGWNFGDPNAAKNWQLWASVVREHMRVRHPCTANAELLRGRPLNDVLVSFFIWTTPTGREMVAGMRVTHCTKGEA